MIIVFTGNGKGKTTAALGQALRALGDGKKALVIQFIKGPWKSGEDFFMEKFAVPQSAFSIIKTGLGFVGILGDAILFEEHRRAAEKGLTLAKEEIESGRWDLVVLDEINNAVFLNLISKEKVLEIIASVSQPAVRIEHLILTGRGAPQEFVDRADIVTEMRDVKHPFEKGVKARRGLEY